jgi:cytochrome c biogenesis protein CcmG/thiol:disulfide interchange protein DsbE
MKNKILPIAITLTFIIIFVIFYKGLQDTNVYTPETSSNNKIAAFSAQLFYSNEIINSSEIFNLDQFYLLNIWSSWCVPCRQEHPLLMDLAKNKNIKIFGLNYKDKRSNAEDFLKELGNPYKKIIFDKEGVNAIELGAYGVPESFLIFKNKIIKKYIGPLNQDSIKQIKQLIK